MTDPGPSKSKRIYRPFKLSKQTGRQFLGLPGSQELFLQTKPGHRFRSPFGDRAGILPHQPKVPDRHKQRDGIKICWRDRTDGAIAIDESVPHRVSAKPPSSKSKNLACPAFGPAVTMRALTPWQSPW